MGPLNQAGDADGQVLAGRYRLTDLLGRGGMGAVWLARDEQLDREVAVKELRLPEHLDDAARRIWVARLEREARAAARLRHPGIVTVYDRVTGEDGRPWIVMELVRGSSLQDLVKAEGPLPPMRVARIGLQVLDALHAAHRAGITHRDVKPANVLLEGDRAVLTDFGIAAVEGDVTLTGTGAVLGTPAYMSPEQVRGQKATAASDLWSLGAMLYTAVEGHPPFEGASPGAIFVAVATQDPATPVHAGPLEPVLRTLLRREPSRRPTAERLRARLTSLVQEQPTAQPDAPGSSALPEDSGTLTGHPVELDALRLDERDQAARRFGYRVSGRPARTVSPELFEQLSQEVRIARERRRFRTRLGTTILLAAIALAVLHAILHSMGVAARDVIPWPAPVSFWACFGGITGGLAIALGPGKGSTRMRAVMRGNPWQVWPCMVTEDVDAATGTNTRFITLMDPGGRPVTSLTQVDTASGGMVMECFPPGPLVLWIAGRLDLRCVVASPFPAGARPNSPAQAFLCRPSTDTETRSLSLGSAGQRWTQMVEHARTVPGSWPTG
ncbi:serine/threonine-protein kinase [Actinomadura rugatobispora]|uniref:non-specific serine/threonine protein kinase n=1 Tax=Actinomadura rugatobispora TaxID=1994 RepID=A0ABW1AEE1_9ACTN